ncbi:hypothetical protein B0T10DRAFT_485409 [Thelonectria olida]|uniref:Peptidase M20 dimerisation domain-containing protein n=1 Tax=Thelonectria olida TaxID=1576542 RepID=A0A9P9ATV8_9HYPO|nr:hypothetical protein B0T10DRAFT_485409 [Thelonectria olida]
MMRYFILNPVTSIVVASAASTLALAFAHENQHLFGPDQTAKNPSHDASSFRCDLSPPIDPSKDGLVSSRQLFSGTEALEIMVKRHQPLVRIPSICYDDLGDFDEDERWKPFHEIPAVMEEAYPNVHKYATVETVNKFGLVYTVEGSDEKLAPILLTAHQDVVPVEEETLDRWEHPPFDAFYNQTDGYLWGRGASDKSAVTALMSAMEALVSQEEYGPRRTVIFAFGFDAECSGDRGAGEISRHLEERYGKGGIAVILDEGGVGLQSLGDTLYALPAVYEKGYLDVWFNLDVVGGQSATPTPHTAIGIMSEIVASLEAYPFRPEIVRNGPVHQGLICQARYSPRAQPVLTELIRWGNLNGAAQVLAQISREAQYSIQTSQAVDWFAGGQKINSLPEFVKVGVNYRYAPQDSIGGIQDRIVHLVEDVVRKYGLRLEAFGDDEDYAKYLVTKGISSQGERPRPVWEPNYKGTLVLEAKKKSYVTPQSPTNGTIWELFAGTVRNTFAREASTVVVAPGVMTGNTDTRHYMNLSKNVYRWSPGSLKSFSNLNTVNERLLMSEHLNMGKFYYDFIRNFNQANL